MSKVTPSKKQHRSMRGKIVDMELLGKRNELTPAAGNARVNARGDELGSGGIITRKREDIVQEHYAQAGKVRQSSGILADTNDSKPGEPTTPIIKTKSSNKPAKKEDKATATKLTASEQALLDDDNDSWTEDTKGNFVKKGDQ